MEERIYTFKNTPAQTQDASLRKYADAQRIQRSALAATPSRPATEDSSAGDLAKVQAEPVAWDGKLPESLQRALNEMRLHCKPHIVSDLEFEVRQVFEGMHTSLSTVRRMYWAANARLEAIDEAQPDPLAAPQAQPLTHLSGSR